MASRRDVGAGLLAGHDSPEPSISLLSGPGTLAIRLLRPVAVGWFAGLAVLGFVVGLVAQSAASAISGSASVTAAVDRLGGHRGGAAAYLGISLLSAAALVAFIAAGQIATTRGEEAAGRLDNLLVQPLSRRRWLAGRLVVAAGVVIAGSVITGIATWVGAASQHSGVGLGQLLAAGLNIAPPALFVLGAGALAYGLRPRTASAFTYGLVAWSLLVEFAASVIKANRWLLDTSVLAHMRPAPAADPNWPAAAVLVCLRAGGGGRRHRAVRPSRRGRRLGPLRAWDACAAKTWYALRRRDVGCVAPPRRGMRWAGEVPEAAATLSKPAAAPPPCGNGGTVVCDRSPQCTSGHKLTP